MMIITITMLTMMMTMILTITIMTTMMLTVMMMMTAMTAVLCRLAARHARAGESGSHLLRHSAHRAARLHLRGAGPLLPLSHGLHGAVRPPGQ